MIGTVYTCIPRTSYLKKNTNYGDPLEVTLNAADQWWGCFFLFCNLKVGHIRPSTLFKGLLMYSSNILHREIQVLREKKIHLSMNCLLFNTSINRQIMVK